MSANAKTPRWAWLLVLLWCFATFGWLWQQQQDFFGVFDPARQLAALPSQLPGELAGALAQSNHAAGQSGNAEEQLWVVLDPDCYCTQAARRHLAELQQRSQRPIIEFTPQQLAQAGIQLPATPVFLWWRDQHLWYAGPLATGAVCGTAGDLLLPLLTGQRQLAGSWRNSESLTCRCVQPVNR